METVFGELDRRDSCASALSDVSLHMGNNANVNHGRCNGVGFVELLLVGSYQEECKVASCGSAAA
jgi:hypothetical protein